MSVKVVVYKYSQQFIRRRNSFVVGVAKRKYFIRIFLPPVVLVVAVIDQVLIYYYVLERKTGLLIKLNSRCVSFYPRVRR